MSGWAAFVAGLAEQLATLPDGAIVKIIEPESTPKQPRYAQFSQSSDRLWAEFIGNEWLEPVDRLDPAAQQLMVEIGWQEPDAEHSDNWWTELPWPVNSAIYGQLASMVATGFRDGFRMADPSELTYEAWNENTGNSPLELPDLESVSAAMLSTPAEALKTYLSSLSTTHAEPHRPVLPWRTLADTEVVALGIRLFLAGKPRTDNPRE